MCWPKAQRRLGLDSQFGELAPGGLQSIRDV